MRADATTKAKAILMAEAKGSAAGAAHVLDLPVRAVQRWVAQGKTDPEIRELAKQMLAQCRAEAAVEVSQAALEGLVLYRTLVQRLTGSDEIEPRMVSALRDLAVANGILIDKLGGVEARPSPTKFGPQAEAPDMAETSRLLAAASRLEDAD